MKFTVRGRIIALMIICYIFIFLFFIPPGIFIGGINYISSDSSVRISQLVYTRIGVYGNAFGVFEMTDRIEHELNAEQVGGLRKLLRNSWYTRRFGDMVFTNISSEVDSFYTYFIIITNADRTISLSLEAGGNMLRGGHYNDWFRIRNSAWEERLLMILSNSNAN